MGSEPVGAPTKEEVLDRIERSYAAVEAAIAPLTAEQVTRVRDANGWTAKDHIAHLAAWRRALAALLTGGDEAAALGVTTIGPTVDEINATVYARARDVSWAEALGALRQAQQQVLDALAPLSIADLSLPRSHYQPGDRPDRDNPVYAWVVGDTYGHDEEHLPALQALAAQD